MKSYLISILFVLFYSHDNNLYCQKIGLFDNMGGHANKNKLLIQENSDLEIVEYSYASGISLNPDSVLISSNAYLAGGSNLKETIYNQNDRLHIFSGVNQPNQLFANQVNYDKNVVTVVSSDSFGITGQPNELHKKVDFRVWSCSVVGSCANSWASGLFTGLAAKLIGKLIEKNGYFPTGAETRAALTAIRKYDKTIDTLLIDKVQTFSDSIGYKESKSYDLHCRNTSDSVKVSICFFDQPYEADKLTINGVQYNSNIIELSFYDTDYIRLDIEFNCCFDSSYTFDTYAVYDTLIDSLELIVLSDSNILVDSIRGYWFNDSLQIAFGRGWQYDTARVRFIQGNISQYIGDTVELYQRHMNLNRIDTLFDFRKNIIHFGIGYIENYRDIKRLPVNFISFDVQKVDDFAQLTFETEEINTSHYLLQKSYDAINFTTFDSVIAINADAYRIYDLIDNNITYYRIVAVDYDYQKTVSKIVALSTEFNRKKLPRGNFNTTGQCLGKQQSLITIKY